MINSLLRCLDFTGYNDFTSRLRKECVLSVSLTLIRAIFSSAHRAGSPSSRKSSSSPIGLVLFHFSGPNSSRFGSILFFSGPESPISWSSLFFSGPDDSSRFGSKRFLFLEWCCLRRVDSLVSSWQEASTLLQRK